MVMALEFGYLIDLKTREEAGAVIVTVSHQSPQVEITRKQEQTSDDLLWEAICWKESRNNPNAYNRKENAVGIAQIRPIYVKDCVDMFGMDVTHNDAYDPVIARRMFETYTKSWCDRFGIPYSDENRARIHNGGYDGWRESCTEEYWESIRNRLKTQ